MTSKLTTVLHERRMTDGALGGAVGVRSQTINKVRHGRRKASPDLALAIEAALDGAVTRADLRPDIWSPAPAQNRAA